jgi:hypothetical protein
MEQVKNDNGLSPEESNETLLSRRHLLKAIAATGGAVAASSLLPSEWVKPVVDAGLLPAHAQVSPQLGTGDLQATLTWNTGNPNAQACSTDNGASGGVDIDLHVIEPDGTHVYFANQTGTTAQLDVDNQVALGPENIFVPPGGAAAGTYQVYVVYYCGQIPTEATIRITVFADTAQEDSATFVRTLNAADFAMGHNVANVTFPGGTIQEATGTRPSAVQLSATKS